MTQTSDRKDDHIRIIRDEDVETTGSGFQDVRLIHDALPEIDRNEIDTSTEFLGHDLDAPIVIESMTGGHPNAKKINRSLAVAAQEANIAMGVGSQRAGLENEEVLESYTVVRDVAPEAFIYGNIGAAQLQTYDIEQLENAVSMIDADAMAIHLNFLQEAVQPEGDTEARGCIEAIGRVVDALSVPVIVKETGNGISAATAECLAEVGVDMIDVAGKGGTTWSGVEAHRAAASDERRSERVGNRFRNWGIPTVISTLESSRHHESVVASGGVRSGLDIAKAISLGATAGGLAKPFLKPAAKGPDSVLRFVEDLTAELTTAMFVTGSPSIEALQEADHVILGRTREYLSQRSR